MPVNRVAHMLDDSPLKIKVALLSLPKHPFLQKHAFIYQEMRKRLGKLYLSAYKKLFEVTRIAVVYTQLGLL